MLHFDQATSLWQRDRLGRPRLNRAASGAGLVRNRVALALRAFQAGRSWQGESFDPWATCPFLRVPGPELPPRTHLTVLVVLNDVLEGAVFGQLESDGWCSDEALLQESRASVFCAPSGPGVLTLQGYEGPPVVWELDLQADKLHLLRIERRGSVWSQELHRRPV